jgi:hypothetical protein
LILIILGIEGAETYLSLGNPSRIFWILIFLLEDSTPEMSRGFSHAPLLDARGTDSHAFDFAIDDGANAL